MCTSPGGADSTKEERASVLEGIVGGDYALVSGDKARLLGLGERRG